VDSIASQPAGHQTLSERTADGHDSGKPPEREALHTLVQSVSQSAASESVHGRDRRNSEATRDTPIQDVRAVPVRVNNGGAISAAYLSDQRAFAQIRARWNPKWNHLYTGLPQRAQVGLIGVGMVVQDRRDADGVSAIVMSDSQEAYNALQSARLAGNGHVKNRKPIQHDPEES
jgi:hypothetical protein